MSDFIFVLKSFLMALVIVYLLQFRVGGQSLESRLTYWMKSSEVSAQTRQAASGAALMIEENLATAKDKIQSLWKSQVGVSTPEKASK